MTSKFYIRISFALAICLFIGFLSSLATQTSIGGWYLQLNKPSFNPPNWIFGPVWTLLYILMGIAAGIVWNKGFYHKWVKTALYHFLIQLLLNASWSLLFFGMQKPFWALIDISVLFVILIFTIKWFKIVSNTAAYLMIPYAVWILFAAVLNFEIWRLNL